MCPIILCGDGQLLDGRGLPPNFAASIIVFISIYHCSRSGQVCGILRRIDVMQLSVTARFSRRQFTQLSVASLPGKLNMRLRQQPLPSADACITILGSFSPILRALRLPWIASGSSVLWKKQGIPFFFFLPIFLRRLYDESTTAVEHAGRVRGHFPMARRVRQGCPASGFLFTMASVR